MKDSRGLFARLANLSRNKSFSLLRNGTLSSRARSRTRFKTSSSSIMVILMPMMLYRSITDALRSHPPQLTGCALRSRNAKTPGWPTTGASLHAPGRSRQSERHGPSDRGSRCSGPSPAKRTNSVEARPTIAGSATQTTSPDRPEQPKPGSVACI